MSSIGDKSILHNFLNINMLTLAPPIDVVVLSSALQMGILIEEHDMFTEGVDQFVLEGHHCCCCNSRDIVGYEESEEYLFEKV